MVNIEPINHVKPPSARGAFYYFRCRLRKMPRLVNLEFTKSCNARCGFCSCWHDSGGEELKDYSSIIRMFRPVVCSVSGGEPLLRKDYAELLKGVRPYCHYLVLITNGALLNETSAKKLVDAGLDQICVSMDFLGPRHSEVRRIGGLFEHLEKTLPVLAGAGYRIVLNTVIMETNLEDVIPIVHRAKEWGVEIAFSSYCALKKDDGVGMIAAHRLEKLAGVINELKHLKRKLKHIKSSDHYLSGVPEYFRKGHVPGCRAGYNWVQVTPDGYIQPCSELPRLFHYSEYERGRLEKVSCTKCWYGCRGESEAQPLEPRRLLELMKA